MVEEIGGDPAVALGSRCHRGDSPLGEFCLLPDNVSWVQRVQRARRAGRAALYLCFALGRFPSFADGGFPGAARFHLSRGHSRRLRQGKLVSDSRRRGRAPVFSRSRRPRARTAQSPKELLMSDQTSFYPELAKEIAPARGKLGVL